jgi:transcriptional regulator with XRE-family HTH domain
MENNFKQIRKQKGLRQQAIAELTGFSISQISRWETGKSNIPSDKLTILKEAYGCDIKDVFGELKPLDKSEIKSTVTPVHNDNLLLRVVGPVSAGVWREHEEWDEDYKYSVPASTKEYSGSVYKRAVLIVEGHSMNLVFPSGTALTVVYTDSGVVEPVDNDYVIVRRTRDGLHEITAKKLVILENGDRELRYESDRPEYLEPGILKKSDRDAVEGEGTKIIAVVLTAIQQIYRRGADH